MCMTILQDYELITILFTQSIQSNLIKSSFSYADPKFLREVPLSLKYFSNSTFGKHYKKYHLNC